MISDVRLTNISFYDFTFPTDFIKVESVVLLLVSRIYTIIVYYNKVHSILGLFCMVAVPRDGGVFIGTMLIQVYFRYSCYYGFGQNCPLK